ncbi:MAG: hypothetical protein ACREQN_18910 [Candidatus Binataceae bacterium]
MKAAKDQDESSFILNTLLETAKRPQSSTDPTKVGFTDFAITAKIHSRSGTPNLRHPAYVGRDYAQDRAPPGYSSQSRGDFCTTIIYGTVVIMLGISEQIVDVYREAGSL